MYVNVLNLIVTKKHHLYEGKVLIVTPTELTLEELKEIFYTQYEVDGADNITMEIEVQDKALHFTTCEPLVRITELTPEEKKNYFSWELNNLFIIRRN